VAGTTGIGRQQEGNATMISLVTHRRDLATGARAMLPWAAGVTPFGLVIGVSAAQAHLPTLAGWLTGPLIYSGSAQIATIEMLDAGASPVAVIVAVLLINARLIFYSTAMAAHWRGTPMLWRLTAGYLLVDPSFVVGVDRYRQPGDRSRAHAHYLGAGLMLWVIWLAAIAVGAVAGVRLPGWLHLEFLVPLYLVGQVVPRLASASTRRAAVVAAAVAVLAVAAPMHLGIPVAIVAGITTGLALPTPATPPASPVSSAQEISR
jgi:predicted branched-subunit amino acid permease